MTNDGEVRASDQDRESTAEVLRQAYTAGRLDLAELTERTGAAYCARIWRELRELTADLPTGPALGTDVRPRPPGSGPQQRERPLAPGRPFRPLLVMACIWLSIAALARAPELLVMPLVVLALWAVYAANWRSQLSRARSEQADLRAGAGSPPGSARPGNGQAGQRSGLS